MKQVYIAKYKNGLKGPTKVLGNDEKSAKDAAYAAWAYTSAMVHPNPSVDNVVASVELDPEQKISGWGIQPTVQIEEGYMKSRDILKEMFSKKPDEEPKVSDEEVVTEVVA